MWHALVLTAGGYGTLVVHELGHLYAGRAPGHNALTVTIGLGPAIARFTDAWGTIWTFQLLPVRSACGFIDEPIPQPRLTLKGARPPRAFRSLGLRERAFVLLGGPFANAALACVLILATYIEDPDFTFVRLANTDNGITFLIGSLSAAIALFNLLPIPPLDGGRLVMLAIEALTGNPIDIKSERRLFRLGAIILSVVTLLGALLFFALPSLVLE
ncbi:site-2 protease family protein [Bradyrhizobium barranii subsp. apii]|uniref:site-2 protease family protein n=1 Tax=Bradyrhizobium barranii TaxID=2992140 RepID=UPI001AA0D9A3|nr:site-2 protease family protein [Bradyrhizobium barranii]UPT93211.1 site-2 protease family protein [Bradyrhizobium barranii subsp. apii]